MMDKIKSLNKNQKTIFSIMIIAVMLFIIVGVMALINDNGKEDDKEKLQDTSKQLESEDLSKAELKEAEKLEAAMEEELKMAGSEKEKEKILEKYNEKISNASGNKVTVEKPSSSKDNISKPNNTSSSNPVSPSDKGNTNTNSTDKKPSSGGSSSSSGNTTKPEKPVEATKPSEPEKPHTHTVSVGNTGKWFDSVDEAEAYYWAEERKWENKFENGEITWDEYVYKAPSHWEWKECMCGKVTLSWWTAAEDAAMKN